MIENTGKLFQLRWRFDFKTGGPIMGMWNSAHITAWDKNKDSLIRASIETKEVSTGIVKTAVECDGHVFRNFQWQAVARVNPAFRGSVTPRTQNIGLKLLTTTQEVMVLLNGLIGHRHLTEEEKKIPFVTFGR